ncbi:MAG: GGDEF domain-containing protein [Ruminococcus sp.]|nr:GGDEF domain-containing protein [Ruminococcus sp.]
MLNGRKIISLCTTRLNDIDNVRYIIKLNDEIKKLDASLFIYNVNTDLYWSDENIRAESAVFGLIDFDITDVVILMYERIKNETISDQIIRKAQSHNVPVIMVDGKREGCINICFNYKKGFEEVVRHVIEHHHVKKPHFLGGFKNNVFSDERMEVFKQVIEENGIKFTEDMVSYGNFWAKPARDAIEVLLAKGNIPDAIICANDIMAINVSAVLFDHGYKVPDDIIVTGFDGIDEINLSIPRMTSSYCGAASVVPSMLNALTDIFERNITTGEYYVEPVLVINNSCGCDILNEDIRNGILRSFNDRFYRYQDDNMVLNAVAESMQSCNDIVDCACKLFTGTIRDTTCVINKDCIECNKNYFAGNSKMEFSDEMFVFFDSNLKTFKQRLFKRKEIIPNVDELIKKGNPLIFNVISYMNVPLGYICFHFTDYDIVDFCKIPQIVNTIGSGLGGFVNLEYQHYLTARIEKMYKYDSLTGLYNRISFNNEFERRKREFADEKIPITVMLVDLDGLKYINDNFGHGAGDNAIRTVAKALMDSVPDDAICVRFGGDEMLAVIIGDCDPDMIKDEINQRLDRYNVKEGKTYLISASMGIYQTDSTQNTDFEFLVKETDEDMYAEKLAKHRNRSE